jgi:hypothetical protein
MKQIPNASIIYGLLIAQEYSAEFILFSGMYHVENQVPTCDMLPRPTRRLSAVGPLKTREYDDFNPLKPV